MRLAHHPARAHDEVEHAGRQSGSRADLDQRPGRCRHEFRGLEDDRAPVGQRGRDLPRGDRDGEVPGGDDPDHPERLAQDVDVDTRPHAAHVLARDAQCFAGEEAEQLRGTQHLTDALGSRLAFFARELLAELGSPSLELEADALEHREALGGRRRSPPRCRVGRRRDREIDLRAVGDRVLTHRVGQVRGVHVGHDRRALDPFAADEVRLRHHVALPQLHTRSARRTRSATRDRSLPVGAPGRCRTPAFIRPG